MKVKPHILRDYLAVHSWVGIVCGLLLFIAFYAGAFSMLEPEIRQWTQPQASKADVSTDIDESLKQFLAQHPEAKGRLSLRLPNADSETPLLRLSTRESEKWFELQRDGKVREADVIKEADNSGNFVDYLHRKGGLPLPLGKLWIFRPAGAWLAQLPRPSLCWRPKLDWVHPARLSSCPRQMERAV